MVYNAASTIRIQRGHHEIIGGSLVYEHIANAPPEATSCVAGAVDGHGREHAVAVLDLGVWEAAPRLAMHWAVWTTVRLGNSRGPDRRFGCEIGGTLRTAERETQPPCPQSGYRSG